MNYNPRYRPYGNRIGCGYVPNRCISDNGQGINNLAGLRIQWVDINGNPKTGVNGYYAWLKKASDNSGVTYSQFNSNAVTILNVPVPTTTLYKLELYNASLFNPKLIMSVYILRGTSEFTVQDQPPRLY
ncbi:hypothetical protein [Paenibacillus herberti]|uniref:Uncharacterized protein n=1 Tax=Paenibacillus herberti TaxID=1619309 RepID=A0A229NTI0_9BACL|nr:hypothetical protein [Paenibacillus herberti]OXM13156.1 hypothetical protein CGZ75_23640 [Paenibacillus herberti]